MEPSKPIILSQNNKQIFYVTKSINDGHWHSTLHSHHFTEFLYVTNGSGAFLVKDKKFDLTKNDLIIINPFVEHTEKALEDTPFEYIAIGIQGIYINGHKESGLSFFNLKDKEDVYLKLFESILKEYTNQEHEFERIIESLLDIFTINLQRNTEVNINSLTEEKKKKKKEAAFIKRYLDTHFRENIDLDNLTTLVHLNKYYLSHSFKESYGVGPIEYLIQRRLKESKILLRDTDYTVSQITTIVGFESHSYFSQLFKKRFDCSPTKYRNQHKN